MSSLYATKSLGRTWLPSPVRSQRSRYGSWPRDPPKLRWLSTETTTRWSKIHERLALLSLVLILGIWWCTCNSAHFLPRPTLRIPSWSSTATSSPEIPIWPNSPLEVDEMAYVVYASHTANLCSAIMQLESLHRLNVTADRILLYPESWNISTNSIEAQLLQKATESYGALLKTVNVPSRNIHPAIPGSNLTNYKFIIVLDLDSTILRSLDGEEFFSELQRQGEGGEATGESSAMILSPSIPLSNYLHNTENVQNALAKYTIPLPRILHTASLRQQSPSSDSNSAKSALTSANIVHFSDAPPWKPMYTEARRTLTPFCPPEQTTCEALEVWQWLYTDFRTRRKEICGVQFNEWEAKEANEEANLRIIPLGERVKGVGGNSGAV